MQVVGAIIRNQKREFLLQQRDNRTQSFPNCWTLFGGIVKDGESPATAIRRELEEEIGLTTKIGSLQEKARYRQPNGTEQIIFEIETELALRSLHLKEGRAMAYVEESALFDRDFAFNIEDVLRQYLTQQNGYSLAA